MLRLEIAGVGEVEKGPLGASKAKMGEFLSIRNCDVPDFAGVNKISNNLVRFGRGGRGRGREPSGLAGSIGRLERVGAGMGAMFTPIVSTKGGRSAMEEGVNPRSGSDELRRFERRMISCARFAGLSH